MCGEVEYRQIMKRISYAGGTIETGDAVAQAMLEYVTNVAQTETNITVEIPTRESDGTMSVHSVVLGPGTQLDITDADASTAGDEAKDFPVPGFGKPAELADTAPPEDADRDAREFDRAVADIEHDLDEQGS